MADTTRNDESVTCLNSLLRGEISAVETYRQAAQHLKDSATKPQLAELEQSHQKRVVALKQRIQQLGGKPSDTSGPWGAFAKLVEGGASILGDKAAVSALEEGEDKGLKDYRQELTKLDPESRRLVETQLLPAQEKTHSTMSSIKRTIH